MLIFFEVPNLDVFLELEAAFVSLRGLPYIAVP
jgi:hypothetical protein